MMSTITSPFRDSILLPGTAFWKDSSYNYRFFFKIWHIPLFSAIVILKAKAHAKYNKYGLFKIQYQQNKF